MKVHIGIHGVITNKLWLVRKQIKLLKKLLKSLLSNYQKVLENKMKDIGLVFDYINGLNYLCHKISYSIHRFSWFNKKQKTAIKFVSE